MACPLGPSGDAGRAALTDRLLFGEQVLSDGLDDFQAVLADPAGIGGPGSGHGAAAAPRDNIHGVGGNGQFQQDRAGSGLAGVGDRLADHHLGHAPHIRRSLARDRRRGLIEEGDGVAAGTGDGHAGRRPTTR